MYQYLRLYEKSGIEVVVSPLFGFYFFSSSGLRKYLIIFFYYFRRLFKLLQVFKFDLVYIEYELFPYFPAVFEKLLKYLGVKYIVDYDDAIFHNYDQSPNVFIKYFLANKIESVVRNSVFVISGSPYLTRYLSGFNSNCIELPTSISLNVSKGLIRNNTKHIFTIGWIGSRTTSPNLLALIPTFESLRKEISFKLILVGFDERLSVYFRNINFQLIDWNGLSEYQEISKFDVGIMPLDDTFFNLGKCGFKLIQYMSCSIPTISTPTEANLKINRNGLNLHASTTVEWYSAFLKVYQNRDRYKVIGEQNFEDFSKYYSIEYNSDTYISIFNEIVN